MLQRGGGGGGCSGPCIRTGQDRKLPGSRTGEVLGGSEEPLEPGDAAARKQRAPGAAAGDTALRPKGLAFPLAVPCLGE